MSLYIINPKTNRKVLKSGRIGKEILAAQKKAKARSSSSTKKRCTLFTKSVKPTHNIQITFTPYSYRIRNRAAPIPTKPSMGTYIRWYKRKYLNTNFNGPNTYNLLEYVHISLIDIKYQGRKLIVNLYWHTREPSNSKKYARQLDFIKLIIVNPDHDCNSPMTRHGCIEGTPKDADVIVTKLPTTTTKRICVLKK